MHKNKILIFLGAEHNSNYEYEIAARHNLQKFAQFSETWNCRGLF